MLIHLFTQFLKYLLLEISDLLSKDLDYVFYRLLKKYEL